MEGKVKRKKAITRKTVSDDDDGDGDDRVNR